MNYSLSFETNYTLETVPLRTSLTSLLVPTILVTNESHTLHHFWKKRSVINRPLWAVFLWLNLLIKNKGEISMLTLPITNLLAHQSLIEWYRSIEKMEESGIVICVLMLKVPGVFSQKVLACDIPRTRDQFLLRREPCFHNDHCLPRKTFSRDATLEANGFN